MNTKGNLPEPDARSALLTQLTSMDWRERQEAIASLVQLDRLDLARSVLELMRQQHGNLNALSSALQVLEHIGRPLTSEFCALLTSPDRELRIYVPLLLGELGGPEVIQALIAAIADNDQPENVRFNAIEALGKLHAAEAVAPLARLLDEGSDFLRYAVVVALGEIGSPVVFESLLPLLHHPQLAEPAVTALGQISERSTGLPEHAFAAAASELARWLKTSWSTGALGVQACAALARGCPNPDLVRSGFLSELGEDAKKCLLDLDEFESAGLLQRKDFCTDLVLVLNWLAVDPASSPASRQAQLHLVRLLAFPEARPAAEATLSQFSMTTRPWLFEALDEVLSGGDAEQRYAAARLLGATGSPAALPALQQAFESEDDILAAWAAQGLGKIGGSDLPAQGAEAGGPSAIDLLWSGLAHRSSFVRRSAVLALAGLKLPGIVERAEALMQQSDPRARESALRLLAELDDRRASLAALAALADPDPNLRRVAAELLPRFSNPQIPAALAQALESPDAGLRRAVAAVLPTAGFGSLRKEDIQALLLRAARDEDGWVRTHALRGLGKLDHPENAPVMLDHLADPLPPVRIAAVEGLSSLLGLVSDESQREHYRRRLEEMRFDPDDGVQRAVRDVLGEN